MLFGGTFGAASGLFGGFKYRARFISAAVSGTPGCWIFNRFLGEVERDSNATFRRFRPLGLAPFGNDADRYRQPTLRGFLEGRSSRS